MTTLARWEDLHISGAVGRSKFIRVKRNPMMTEYLVGYRDGTPIHDHLGVNGDAILFHAKRVSGLELTVSGGSVIVSDRTDRSELPVSSGSLF